MHMLCARKHIWLGAAPAVQVGALQLSFQLGGFTSNSDTVSSAVKAASYGADMSVDGGATWSNIAAATTKPGHSGSGVINAVVPASALGKTAYFRVIASTTDARRCASGSRLAGLGVVASALWPRRSGLGVRASAVGPRRARALCHSRLAPLRKAAGAHTPAKGLPPFWEGGQTRAGQTRGGQRGCEA